LKKLAAILLLVIFAFNTIGYRLVFNLLESSADATFTAKINAGKYNDKEFITIKVPINMPYLSNPKDLERVDGEVTVNGQVYKYVMRKVESDTMTLLCLPHYEKTQLQNKANEFAGKVNDLPSNDNNKKAEVFKQLTADYDIIYSAASISSTNVQAVSNLYLNTKLSQQFLPVNGQPPEIIA
jgi:hypothetical protein